MNTLKNYHFVAFNTIYQHYTGTGMLQDCINITLLSCTIHMFCDYRSELCGNLDQRGFSSPVVILTVDKFLISDSRYNTLHPMYMHLCICETLPNNCNCRTSKTVRRTHSAERECNNVLMSTAIVIMVAVVIVLE